MALGADHDLVPLGAGFDITKRGYNRMQVEEHLEQLDGQLKMLAADRDAAASTAADLARQLENARTEIDNLHGQVERLSLPPTTLEGLSERLQRMLRLAQDEASETKARAEAECVHIRAKAETDASELRQRYEKLIGELDNRRSEMESEHRGELDKARAEAELMLSKAADERARADEEAEQRRSTVEEDFEIAMASRRTESMRALAEQEATSKAEAERRVREAIDEAARRRHESITEANARLKEATDEAHRRVREATDVANRRISHAAQRVSGLRQLRATLANQLNSARDLVANAHLALESATPALDPLPDDEADTRPSPTPKGQRAAAEQGHIEGAVVDPAADAPTRTLRPAGPPPEDWEPEEVRAAQEEVTKPVTSPARPGR